MCHVQKSYLLCNITNPKRLFFQQLLRFCNPRSVQKLRKTVTGMLIQQFTQMPLTDISLLCYFQKRQSLCVVIFYISHCIFHNKTICHITFFFWALRLRNCCFLSESLNHSLHRFFNLFHAGGFQKKSSHA